MLIAANAGNDGPELGVQRGWFWQWGGVGGAGIARRRAAARERDGIPGSCLDLIARDGRGSGIVRWPALRGA